LDSKSHLLACPVVRPATAHIEGGSVDEGLREALPVASPTAASVRIIAVLAAPAHPIVAFEAFLAHLIAR